MTSASAVGMMPRPRELAGDPVAKVGGVGRAARDRADRDLPGELLSHEQGEGVAEAETGVASQGPNGVAVPAPTIGRRDPGRRLPTVRATRDSSGGSSATRRHREVAAAAISPGRAQERLASPRSRAPIPGSRGHGVQDHCRDRCPRVARQHAGRIGAKTASRHAPHSLIQAGSR